MTITLLGFAEPVASWLHLFGAVIAACFIGDLCRRGATPADRRALAVFGGATVLALLLSGLYHLLAPTSAARAVLQRLDHAGIWLLIASTFTPVHVTLFRGAMRWGVLGFVWACALAGIVLKTIFFAQFSEALGLTLYIGFGWIGALSGVALARNHGWRVIGPLLVGGALYSLGGVVSVLEAPIVVPGFLGHHELFHLAVLGGLVAHWRFMHGLEPLRAREVRRTTAPIAAVAA